MRQHITRARGISPQGYRQSFCVAQDSEARPA